MSYWVRGPLCMVSTAVAHSSVSALAIRAKTTAAFQTSPVPAHPHPGQLIGGRASPSSRLADTSTRFTPSPKTSFNAIPTATATTAAGMNFSRVGLVNFQKARTRRATSPMTAAAAWLASALRRRDEPLPDRLGDGEQPLDDLRSAARRPP